MKISELLINITNWLNPQGIMPGQKKKKKPQQENHHSNNNPKCPIVYDFTYITF